MMLLENHHPYNLSATPNLTTSLLLSSLLHDIGTIPDFISSTHLSFELFGAMHAHTLLLSPPFAATRDEAELVAEVITRHQDLGDVGKVPAVLGLIYFATLLDNVGANAKLVDRESVRDVTDRFPREGWSGCFAEVIRRELEVKPWAHTSVVEGFEEKVLGNDVMREFE
jgi:cyanamide hydratase